MLIFELNPRLFQKQPSTDFLYKSYTKIFPKIHGKKTSDEVSFYLSGRICPIILLKKNYSIIDAYLWTLKIKIQKSFFSEYYWANASVSFMRSTEKKFINVFQWILLGECFCKFYEIYRKKIHKCFSRSGIFLKTEWI